MKYSKCCVPCCNSLRQDVMLHKIPSCEKRRQQWLISINCDSLRRLSVAELTRLQVCHKHFEKRFVTDKSRILMSAYPTLFTDEEITTGIPTSNLTNAEHNPHGDQSYSRERHFDHTYCRLDPQQHAVASTSSKSDGPTTLCHVESVLPANTEAVTISSHFEGTLQSKMVPQVKLPDAPTTSSYVERALPSSMDNVTTSSGIVGTLQSEMVTQVKLPGCSRP